MCVHRPSRSPAPAHPRTPSADAVAQAQNHRRAENLGALRQRPLLPLLLGLSDARLRARVDAEAPATFRLPTGRTVPITYHRGGAATVRVKLQALFGLRRHPHIGSGEQVPLNFELLAPNQRVAQITSDLPNFWAGSYQEVRRNLRGRYPKHPWPEDPLSATPSEESKKVIARRLERDSSHEGKGVQ